MVYHYNDKLLGTIGVDLTTQVSKVKYIGTGKDPVNALRLNCVATPHSIDEVSSSLALESVSNESIL